MRIRMLKTMPGSPDGLRVQEYAEGLHEDVADELALAFIGMGAAEALGGKIEMPEDGGAAALETPEKPARKPGRRKAADA